MSAVRHKASTRAQVERHHAAGWSFDDIREILRHEGVDPVPSVSTMWTWVNPDRERRQRAHQRRARARERLASATYRWPGVRTPEWKIGRIRVLAAAGLSASAVAKIMSHDFPDTPLTEHQVYGLLREGTTPRPLRRAAT